MKPQFGSTVGCLCLYSFLENKGKFANYAEIFICVWLYKIISFEKCILSNTRDNVYNVEGRKNTGKGYKNISVFFTEER